MIIFLATIRLQSRGYVVYDPSVGAADSSPWQGSQGQQLSAGEATPPVRNPSGSQANHLPLTGEAMTIHLTGEAMAIHLTGEATPQSAEPTASLDRGAKGDGLRCCSLCLPCQGEVGQAQSAWLGGVAFLTTTQAATPQSAELTAPLGRGADPSVGNPSGSQVNLLPLQGRQ